MSKVKHGLGRGLDALINPKVKDEVDNPVTLDSKNIKTDDGESFDIIAKIPTNSITPNPYQPRLEFDREALDELKNSILENGLIQPITVRRKPNNEGYELISGERRLRACREIGYKQIPAYIIKIESKEAMVALSLIENIQREKLNAIEVANAYQQLINECNLSQEEIAKRVGKNRTTITNSLRLLKLPGEVQECLIREEINAGHARALINLNDKNLQTEITRKIIKNNLSVRKVEKMVKEYLNSGNSKKDQETKEKKKIDYISQNDLENKLRNSLGTKVLCKQKKDGSGEIVIEFYSGDELERLLDLLTQTDY